LAWADVVYSHYDNGFYLEIFQFFLWNNLLIFWLALNDFYKWVDRNLLAFIAVGLERLAELGQIVGPEGVNVRATAFDFAARWRHGMMEGWPLYMPCFFVTAIALWCRALVSTCVGSWPNV